MARNWTEAQERERAFWERIYVEKRDDIRSYQPIDRDIAIDFTTKTFRRHHLSLSAVDGKTVADIGCGPYGVLYGILQSRSQFARPPVLIGVDPLMEFYITKIGLLRREDDVELHQGRAEALPIADASCDFVFCVNALDHVDDPVRSIEDLHRITRPGGLCAVSLHTVTRLFSPVHPILKYVDSNHPHHFTVERIRKLLAFRFAKVEVSHIATMTQDQPEFAFKYILRSPNKPVAFLRWISTFVLQSVYFNCVKFV
jgi:SAM-dependent methyltransferase